MVLALVIEAIFLATKSIPTKKSKRKYSKVIFYAICLSFHLIKSLQKPSFSWSILSLQKNQKVLTWNLTSALKISSYLSFWNKKTYIRKRTLVWNAGKQRFVEDDHRRKGKGMDKNIQFLLPVLPEIKYYHSCWERSLFWLFFDPWDTFCSWSVKLHWNLGDCCRKRLKGGTETLTTPRVPYFPMFCTHAVRERSASIFPHVLYTCNERKIHQQVTQSGCH